MNRECNNRVRNGQYRVWGVPKNIYNLGMIFSAFCLDTMLPKGTVLEEVGTMLARGAWELDDKGNKVPKVGKNGQVLKTKSGKVIYKRTPYKIKVFNTINFAKSMHYNPFAYIHTEQDVLKFVNTLIANTKGEGAQSGEDFWVKAERLLFTAYVAYIVKYCKKSERNFVSLLAMIDASETREEDEDFENAIDLMFKDIEFGNDEEGIEADPDSFAVRQYFKDKKSHYVSEDNWVIFENTQEPIIDQQTFDTVQKLRENVRRYPDGWGEHHVLTGLMYCADCGAKMYVHRTSNGKRIAQYTCSAYTKVPCGTLCKTQHRINESVVLELIGDTLRAIFEYAKYDRSEFIDTITMAQSTQEDAEVKKVRARIAVAGNRCEELEKLICRIYEDNILGKLPDSRYEVLDKQYAREKAELDAEIKELEAKLTEYEKSRNSAGKFIALIDKYEKFEELTPAMVNEFVDKVLVHERDRKGSIQTTQEIEIYFNFVGRYVPPAMMTEPTAEEQAEIDRINRIKDRRHQQYLRRKESGWQRKYEERVKNEKRAKMQAMKEEIRRQDRENGVYATAGSLALEPTIGMPE